MAIEWQNDVGCGDTEGGITPVEMAGRVKFEGLPVPEAIGGGVTAGEGAAAPALAPSAPIAPFALALSVPLLVLVLLELGRRVLSRGISCSASVVHTPAQTSTLMRMLCGLEA